MGLGDNLQLKVGLPQGFQTFLHRWLSGKTLPLELDQSLTVFPLENQEFLG